MDSIREGDLILITIGLGAIALGITIARYKDELVDDLMEAFKQSGEKNGVDPLLLRAIQHKENPKRLRTKVRNKDGSFDYGIMQINEKTFQHYKVPENLWLEDLAGIQVAGQYMADTKKELETAGKFDLLNWIASYNIGTPTVIKYGIRGGSYTGEVYFYYTLYRAAAA